MIPRIELLLAALLLLPACRLGVAPTTSGGVTDRGPAEVGLTSAEIERLRGGLRRRDALLKLSRGGPSVTAQQRRTRLALKLLQEIEGLAGAASPRAAERDAVRAYARFLRDVLQAEAADEGGGAPVPEELLDPGRRRLEFSGIVAVHDEGRIEDAITLGLDELDQLRIVGLDSLSLRFLLATWALELEQWGLAEQLFSDVAGGAGAVLTLSEDAARRAELARAAALGPDAVALAEAMSLLNSGQVGDAWEALGRLAQDAADPSVAAEAAAQREIIAQQAQERAEEIFARADGLLAGPGPYDFVGELLAEVEVFPPGSYDRGELRRLLAWYRGLTDEAERGQAAVAAVEQDAVLGEARALVAADRYRDSLGVFARLDGTPLQAKARAEAQRAAEALVKAERERAGKLFMAARKKDGTARTAALEQVRVLLQGLLDEFPESSYAARVATNLEAVRRELDKE